jgi:uncharacterized protein (DUF433 family)
MGLRVLGNSQSYKFIPKRICFIRSYIIMKPEDCFDFVTPEDIRLKGHRIGIDDVLGYYMEGYAPEEIAAALPTLTLEQIHATIAYYLNHQAEVGSYLSELASWREKRYQEWLSEPPSPAVMRLRALKAHRRSANEGAVSA